MGNMLLLRLQSRVLPKNQYDTRLVDILLPVAATGKELSGLGSSRTLHVPENATLLGWTEAPQTSGL